MCGALPRNGADDCAGTVAYRPRVYVVSVLCPEQDSAPQVGYGAGVKNTIIK